MNFPDFQRWVGQDGKLTAEAIEYLARLLARLAELEARVTELEP